MESSGAARIAVDVRLVSSCFAAPSHRNQLIRSGFTPSKVKDNPDAGARLVEIP
jgi:hypothetical protein